MQLYQNAINSFNTQQIRAQQDSFFVVRSLLQGEQQFSFGLTDESVANELAGILRSLQGLDVEVKSFARCPTQAGSVRSFEYLTEITRQILDSTAGDRQQGRAFLVAFLERFSAKMPAKELKAITGAVNVQPRGQNVACLQAFRARVGGAK
ncbi:hypothetical protein [Pseudomonas putida]|uniref:hypothetical protein n=1 Tax=Pseudomonas putida TaxID=303 RepID=UPI003D979C69